MIIGIWAEDEAGLIGEADKMPWSLPAEQKHFKETTMNQVILMGRPNGQKDPNTVLAQGSVREILTDSRLLIQAGIVPPMAVRMYEDLKLAGIELNRCPLTKEELAEALCRWKSEN